MKVSSKLAGLGLAASLLAQPALAADPHTHNARVPAGNDLAGP